MTNSGDASIPILVEMTKLPTSTLVEITTTIIYLQSLGQDGEKEGEEEKELLIPIMTKWAGS